MWLLFLVLKDETHIRPLVGILLEMELFDATVLDGEGIENLAVRSVPVLSEVSALFGQSLAYNRTLWIPLDDRDQVRTLVDLARREGVNLTDPEVALLRLVPCETYREEPDAG